MPTSQDIDRMIALVARLADELLMLKEGGDNSVQLPNSILEGVDELFRITYEESPTQNSKNPEAPVPVNSLADQPSAPKAVIAEKVDTILPSETKDITIVPSEPSSTNTPITGSPAQRPQEPPLLLSFFSVNDIFLYRRELFGGNDNRFRQALSELGSCTTADQARQILLYEYGLNPREATAKTFLQTIGTLFEG